VVVLGLRKVYKSCNIFAAKLIAKEMDYLPDLLSIAKFGIDLSLRMIHCY